jgi:hypothetical protein
MPCSSTDLRHHLIWGTSLLFTWKHWGKPQNTSVEVASLQADLNMVLPTYETKTLAIWLQCSMCTRLVFGQFHENLYKKNELLLLLLIFLFVCHEIVGFISNHHLFLFHCGIPDWLALGWNMPGTLYLLQILVNPYTYRESLLQQTYFILFSIIILMYLNV